jgi:hypothetical protein
MRIETVYGKRTLHFSSEQIEKPKYFFAYEGSYTEADYFRGIIDNREAIGIRPLIELVPLLRSFVFESEGHPKRVFQQLTEHLKNIDSMESIIEMSVDYLCLNNKFLNARRLCENFKEYIGQINISKDIPKEALLNEITGYMESKHNITTHIDDLRDYLSSQVVTYDNELDSVCIIIDRNIRSLKDGYRDFLEMCNNNGFKLYVSNPDFELWLLMHSDRIFDYDRIEMLENKKCNKSRRFLERALSEVFHGYRKENIQFSKFLPFIKQAITNEKQFCEEISDLENELGSNIGVLLEELIDLV